MKGSSLTGLAVSVFVLFTSLGCKTTGTAVGPAKAFTAPDWATQNIASLAFLGLASPTIDDTRRQTAEEIVESDLRAGQNRFVVLSSSSTRERARKASAEETLRRVQEAWKSQQTVDQFVASELCQKLGVDGILIGELADWSEERVDFNADGGTSFTRVGLTLTIVSGKSGLAAWEAEKTVREESAAYIGGQSGSAVYVDGTGTTRSGNKDMMTPDPPPIEDVARKVTTALFEAFPPTPIH